MTYLLEVIAVLDRLASSDFLLFFFFFEVRHAAVLCSFSCITSCIIYVVYIIRYFVLFFAQQQANAIAINAII